MPIRLPRYALPVLLVVFVLLGLAFNLSVPLGEASDEVSHYAYIQYLVEHHQLPEPEGAVLGEAHQPPLYYLMGALLTFWIPQQDFQAIANPDFQLDDPQTPNYLLHPRSEAFPYHDNALAWHLVRLLSTVLGAITVWATWRIAAGFFSPDSWMPFGAAALVALLPGFLFISGVVNNDNLIITLSALSVLQITRMTRRRYNPRDSLVLGLLLGLAILAKLSGLVLWLFNTAMLLWWLFEGRNWKQLALHSAIVVGVAGALVAPWVLYNLAATGDPFRWSAYLAIITPRREPLTLQTTADIAQALAMSFWGSFGGVLHLKMASAVYLILNAAALLGLLGWVGYAFDAHGRQLGPNIRFLLVTFLAFWLVLLSAYVRWAITDMATGQARLLYPGLPLWAIFMTAGFARLIPGKVKFAIGFWTAGLFGLSIAVLLFLHSLFAPPILDLHALPPLAPDRAPADFGRTIRVVDYQIDSVQVTPGGSLVVHIYWQALSNPQEDYWMLLQLANKDGAVANRDGVPSAGKTTTDWWQKGEVYESRHTFALPNDLAPGIYTLRLGLHPFNRWEWLPVQGAEMLQLDRITVTGSR